MTGCSCRTAEQSDVPRLVEIHQAAILERGPSHYTDRQVEAWATEARPAAYPVDDAASVVLLAETDDIVVGTGQLNTDRPEIAKLFVHPDFSERGVGTVLLERLEREARDRTVDDLFLDSSLNAADFYHENGYEYGTMLNKHLPIGDGDVVYPALRMWKSFDGG